MTINEIKADANTDIRLKTLANSVTRDEVADLFDALADEQRDRGVTIVANTAALATLAGTNYKYAIVTDIGIFEYAASGTPNGTTIFAAVSGVWVAKFLTTDISGKQNTLVSGTNIKTINSQPITGPGNINIVTADEIEEYANLAAFPSTGNAEKIYVAVDTQSLYRWTGSVYVQVSGGGGGGSQTLDQVLVSGRTTDEDIIFDETLTAPAPSGSVTKDWIVFKPLVKGTNYGVDFAFRQASVNFDFANPLNQAYDEIVLYGWNLAAGGGLQESSVVPYANLAAFPGTGVYNTIYRANDTGFHYNWNGSAYVLGRKRGRTAIGSSWEQRYNAYDNGDMVTEMHDVYVNALGEQHRIASYTINTTNDVIDYYHTVSRMYMYHPSNHNIQYFLVQPGSLMVAENTGVVSVGLIAQYQVDQGGLKNVARIAGTNTDILVFQGFAEIAFSGASLSSVAIINSSINASTLTYVNLSSNILIGDYTHYATANVNKNILSQIDATNNFLAIYLQGGINEIRYYNLASMDLGSGGIYAAAGVFTQSGSNPVLYLRYAGWDNYMTASVGSTGNATFNLIGTDPRFIFSKPVELMGGTKAGDPTTTDVPAGKFMMWKNTTSGDLKLWANDGGTLKSVTLT